MITLGIAILYKYRYNGSGISYFKRDGLSWEVKTLSGFDTDCMDPDVVLADDGSLIMFFAAPRTTAKGGDPDVIKLPDGQYRIYYYGMIGDSSNIFSATAESL